MNLKILGKENLTIFAPYHAFLYSVGNFGNSLIEAKINIIKVYLATPCQDIFVGTLIASYPIGTQRPTLQSSPELGRNFLLFFLPHCIIVCMCVKNSLSIAQHISWKGISRVTVFYGKRNFPQVKGFFLKPFPHFLNFQYESQQKHN